MNLELHHKITATHLQRQAYLYVRQSTLRQVLLWYHQENITIPLARAGQGEPRTVWRLPNYQHLLRMLKNPPTPVLSLMAGLNVKRWL